MKYVSPGNIYNCDETNLTDDLGPKKCICPTNLEELPKQVFP